MPTPLPQDLPRHEQRLAWARAAAGEPGASLERASTDAGFRSYWRLYGGGSTRIVMDSPPDLEDVWPWLRVRDLLGDAGVRVPAVLARDEVQGFLLLEDLGGDTYLQVLGDGNADALFDAAITQLLKLQAVRVDDAFPAYDEALLLRELRLFDEWFLGRHLGITLDPEAAARLEDIHRLLVDAALDQAQVLVHRDFMPRNLMPAADGPAVLDFQDAVRGPIAYDPLCLFKDAFVSWPQSRVDGWLARYHARARDAGLPVPDLERFHRDADLIGVQRHLKVLGIFARLRHRDGKPRYLEDAPRFLAYLDAVLPRYPALAPLAELIDTRVRPRLRDANEKGSK
ncbi:aminoglycoside phosphotransferase family protein [Luteimonas vadosa]|uniref:Phosphotransferase n=1 Tax=Luteimonas vadosa TaxID=1165507 RepID=A0ABP9DY05_9GAMM